MPFQSEAQRRFMFVHHPDIAEKWAHEYPGQGPKNLPMHVTDEQQTKRTAVLDQMKGAPHGGLR